MTAETPSKSTLEMTEAACYETIATAEDPYKVRDALTELGFVHLSMELGKFPQAMQEIWASMRGRSGLENLGIIAITLGTLYNTGKNQLTDNYAATKRTSAK